MKTILCFLLMASTAFAGPFLVCDPNSYATSYEISGDITANPQAESDGSLRYDLAGIEVKAHNIDVKSCNMWGCSTPVPFSFEKKLPASPTNTRLEP